MNKEYAKLYCSLGMNVIPIMNKTKTPCIAWGRFINEKVTEKEIDEWWDRWPEANIAIICGKVSDCIVVDVDPRNGGSESAKGWGQFATPTTLTPNKGYHLYFKYDPSISKSKPLPGIDVQSEGSYVLVPPSETVGKYAFSPGKSLQIPRMSMPIELKNKLFPPKTNGNSILNNNEKNWISDALENGADIGKQDDTLAKMSGYFAKKQIPIEVAFSILMPWAEKLPTRKEDPWTPESVRKTIESIYKKEASRYSDFSSAPSMAEVMKQGTPDPKWMIDSLWPDGVGFVAGDSEQGKTWFVLDMALSVNLGLDFLSEHKVPETGPVLLIEEEQSIQQISQRVRLLLRPHGIDPTSLKTFYHWTQKGLKFPEATQGLIRFIKDHSVRALFIDSLSAVHRGDEISNRDMQPILQSFSEINKQTGASVIVIHHMAKPNQHQSRNPLWRLRGNSALLAWADTVIAFVPQENGNAKLIFKMRGAPKPEPFELIRDFDPLKQSVKLGRLGI